ncbi:hypothetical protein B0J13DRAFT_527886 [Dactylonectria estremocensis]|uniref:Uncharacterized protein n=1 Tax=Dactylonectria estremocensis TaxID=1079267 RepID=A0A9P9EID3_9HYPO|nr:hypothetical protein B0J13DRAFT_527886 [Dactylonectria estremocensis]
MVVNGGGAEGVWEENAARGVWSGGRSVEVWLVAESGLRVLPMFPRRAATRGMGQKSRHHLRLSRLKERRKNKREKKGPGTSGRPNARPAAVHRVQHQCTTAMYSARQSQCSVHSSGSEIIPQNQPQSHLFRSSTARPLGVPMACRSYMARFPALWCVWAARRRRKTARWRRDRLRVLPRAEVPRWWLGPSTGFSVGTVGSSWENGALVRLV